MPYINLTSHEKLLRYSDSLKISKHTSDKSFKEDTQDGLFKDIQQLDEIVKNYKKTISALHDFSNEYKSVHKKVRSALRKLRMENVRKIDRYY